MLTTFRLRRQLEAGRLALPRDEKMAEELTALRCNLRPTGKVVIEAWCRGWQVGGFTSRFA